MYVDLAMAFVLPLAVRPSTLLRRRRHAAPPRCSVPGTGEAVAEALRVAYTEYHAVPSSAGCAHDLGRRAATARDAAMQVAAKCLGGDSTCATAHHTAAHAAADALRAAKLGAGDGVLLALGDDPRWTGPLAAEVLRLGASVQWVSDATRLDKVAAAASGGGVRAAALQMVSPLTGRAACEALDFLRDAGIWTVVDASHAAAVSAIEAAAGDVVICGGEALGAGGAFAALALWTPKAHALRRAGDACVDGHVGAAALGALATTLEQVELLRVGNGGLLMAVSDAVAESIDERRMLSAVGDELRYPSISVTFTSDEAAVEAARRLYAADGAACAKAALRVVRAYSTGRGRRKLGRQATLSAHFHSTLHTASDAGRFTRALLGECTS